MIYRTMMLVIAVCFSHMLSFSSVTAQTSKEYTLNVQDVLKIRVGSWDVTNNVYEQWQGLSGDYTVGSDGKISFPYAGSIPVAEKTINEVSLVIAQKLKVSIGLPDFPAVAIEIASYNPVFVTGDVYKPGQYKYRPNMSVRQAIAMAGGVGRAGSNSARIERDIMRAYGQRRKLVQGQQRLLLRISRLEAEINEAENYAAPEEIQNNLLDGSLIAIEESIFANNTDALKQRILSVEELIELLANVIGKLESQLALTEEDVKRTEKDLKQKQALLQKGTIRANAVATVASNLTELRLRQIQLTVEKLRAEQSLNQSKREKLDISKQNKATLLRDLDTARTELTELSVAIDTQTDLYASALQLGANSTDISIDSPLSILVIGHGNEASDSTFGNEKTILKPGDTVVIRVPESTVDTDQIQ